MYPLNPFVPPSLAPIVVVVVIAGTEVLSDVENTCAPLINPFRVPDALDTARWNQDPKTMLASAMNN